MNRVVPHNLELESYESKGTNSYSTANLGRPKVSNYSTLWSQSGRITRVGTKIQLGSVAGELNSGIRSYSVGLHNNVPSKLISLQEYCKDNVDKMIDRKLYNLFYDPKMYEIVYDKLKSKPGNMTPGLTPDTLDGLNIEFINKVILSLKDESFQFKPSRTIEIPNPKNKVRIGIASPRDKIVMGVMCMILEIIFEPRFSNCSHGFRPGRGCHTALKQAESSLKSSVYIIEGDIKGCFDNINHGILMSILSKHIADKRFLNLIAKGLKAGYGEHLQNLKYDIVGTPQGSVLSPILCNIYLDNLDKFIMEIEKDFNRGTKSTRNKEYHRISTRARRARENNNLELARQYRQQLKHIPFTIQDNTFRKVVYIRYADD
jgi:nicotine oxidoreductase